MAKAAQLVEPYASRPLHATADGIRLVTIEPVLDANGMICCQLAASTFANRPKYDTLSYRWGDETLTRDIIVNGTHLAVTLNLWAALDYLRQSGFISQIWIDAVSINQRDVPERSRQLRIMPHIYARASSTIVWLGPAYTSKPLSLVESTEGPGAQLRDQILADGYWHRVWIVQELGKARHIKLCLGLQPIDWDVFVGWLESQGDDVSSSQSGPLGLNRVRKEKYNGSCSLRELLTNHASALCKDPRDKVYGLVGLSTDGRGFPMDYSKSLLEVWSDTITFMGHHQLLPNDVDEQIRFCRLVRDLLGGAALGGVSGIVDLVDEDEGDETPEMEVDGDISQSGLTFDCSCYGVITSLGPSARELLSSLELTDAWEGELQRLYRGDLDQAHLENDSLMKRILDSSTGQLVELDSFPHRRHRFQGPEMYGQFWDFMNPGKRVAPALEGCWAHDTSTPQEPRLAMLRLSHAKWDRTPFKVVFVSPQARQGDFVCRVLGHPMKRIVVRAAPAEDSNNVEMYVCGTALTVRDVLAEDTFDDSEMPQGCYRIDVSMDARTLYALIFERE